MAKSKTAFLMSGVAPILLAVVCAAVAGAVLKENDPVVARPPAVSETTVIRLDSGSGAVPPDLLGSSAVTPEESGAWMLLQERYRGVPSEKLQGEDRVRYVVVDSASRRWPRHILPVADGRRVLLVPKGYAQTDELEVRVYTGLDLIATFPLDPLAAPESLIQGESTAHPSLAAYLDEKHQLAIKATAGTEIEIAPERLPFARADGQRRILHEGNGWKVTLPIHANHQYLPDRIQVRVLTASGSQSWVLPVTKAPQARREMGTPQVTQPILRQPVTEE